ncbi:MAG: arylsulfatase [Saprospiraceae bacterium]|nr:arylsulfatase [Saprospiraceae bacterium]
MTTIKKNLLLTICCTILLACQQKADDVSTTSHPPNIIYILADDLGYGDLSCYGQKELHTPHIDRLASEGILFTQHYAGATVCAPSRASLLTGKHTGHTSVRGNSPAPQLISSEEWTIAEVLKEAGYRTAIIGKWGVGNPPEPDDPIQHGFDEAYGYINMWHAHNFYPEFLYKQAKKVILPGNKTDQQFPYRADMPEGTGVAKEKKTYVLGEFDREVSSFITRHKDQPFFLYLALNMPHANNEAGRFTGNGMEVPMTTIDGKKIPDYGSYTDRDWPEPEKGFAQMLRLIDQTVGKIESTLTQHRIVENTLIVFTSDNGPHQEGKHNVDFFDSNGKFRGKKRDLYEGGIRVPMIAKWPAKIGAGSITDHLSAFWDVLPTFCDVAQVEIPKDIDGISFLPTLVNNPSNQPEHKFLYWEFYEQGGKQAIRKDNWKYIRLDVRDSTKAIKQELYDLSIDPSESTNIIADHEEMAQSLELLMEQAHTPHQLLSLF